MSRAVGALTARLLRARAGSGVSATALAPSFSSLGSRGGFGGLFGAWRRPGPVSTMLASSALQGTAEAAAEAAVRTLVAALGPRERLPTLDAGTDGTRVLWQALLSNYSPGALQHAQQAQLTDEAAQPRHTRAAEYGQVSGGGADRCAGPWVSRACMASMRAC